jgi:tRNA modification GTPase
VLNLHGRIFRFIDTAGIRDTKNTIETIGISRTYKKMEQASIVLWMFDAQQPFNDIIRMQKRIYMLTEAEKILPVANKCDLITDVKRKQIQEKIQDAIFLAAKKGIGIELLIDNLITKSNISEVDTQEVVISNLRHYEALTRAIASMEKVISGLDSKLAGDFLAQDIRETTVILGEITGNVSDMDILKNIFEKFCIGK